MAFNGSGTFALYTPGNPTITGTTISSTAFNNTLNDIATGLSNAVTRDGQSPLTSNLPMGTKKLTGLAAGTTAGDSVRFEQTTLKTADTGSTILPASTTANRDATPSAGYMRFNTTTTEFEGYDGSTWGAIGSGAQTGANSDITSLNGLTSPVVPVRQLQPIGASVGSNALTISASALALEFRSTTLGSGAVTFVQGTPTNLVISSGSTLGTASAQQSRIVVLALNNAGTIELAAVNISGGVNLDETGVINTTAEGGAGAADSAAVIYSTTARTGVAYRVIGYVESTQATAGTWATAPSTVQGYGGQALAAMSSLGYGQTWQTVTRTSGTTYYNTTGKPIFLEQTSTSGSGDYTLTVNSFSFSAISTASTFTTNQVIRSVVIPVSASYSYTATGTAVIASKELR